MFRGRIPRGKRTVMVLVMGAAIVSSVSCGKPVEFTLERSRCGKALIADGRGEGHYLLVSRTMDKLLFRRDPAPEEAEKAANDIMEGNPGPGANFIGTEPGSGSLDLCYLKDGKCETLLEGFVSFDLHRARGLLESAPEAMARGGQNLGRIGLLLPLYKAGISSPDWVVFNTTERKLYTIGGPGLPASPVGEKFHCDGAEPLYRGGRQTAIASPAWQVVATLSREGRMSLFSWPEGKKLHEAEGVFCICFHPVNKILYFGSKDGLCSLAWEKTGKEAVKKLTATPARLIRVSSRGSYLFALAIGGRTRPSVISLTTLGQYREEPLELSKKYGEADDWVWLDDRRLLLVFDQPDALYYWELDVRKGEYYETMLDRKTSDVSIIAVNQYPSVVRSDRVPNGSREAGRLDRFDARKGRFEPLKGVPGGFRLDRLKKS